MTSLVRLRVAIADRPGALAQVASVIAGHGGNITAVDVHGAGATAVDDLTVDFPSPADMPKLRAELEETGAGTLLSHQAAHAIDPVVAAIRRAATMAAASPLPADASERALVAAISEVCAAPFTWMASVDEAHSFSAGRMAIERGGAVSMQTTDVPVAALAVVPNEPWLLVVPDPEQGPRGRIAFVARTNGPFTSTEIARVEAFMSLHSQLAEATDP